MVKKNTQKAKKRGQQNGRNMQGYAAKSKQVSKMLSNRQNPTFGAISTINTAPVAIGNSMRGAQARVVSRAGDSVRVVGRDFAFQPAATGAVTGWVNVGGFPLTPTAFVSSILRSYCQIYNKFKFNKVNAHYITSSSTSSTGDVMFQINKNRDDPCANNTATTFLSYALSDPDTIIGPQWTNHTASMVPKGPFRTLDVGVNSDINAQSQGELFLFSKTTTTDSPGWVIIDYDITFAEMSINPRAGLIPNSAIIYSPIQLILPFPKTFVLNSTQISFNLGTRWIGNTVIPNPIINSAAGDIFKVQLDITNTIPGNWTVTSGTQPTAANLLDTFVTGSFNLPIPLTDGITLYGEVISTGVMVLYNNIVQAFATSTNSDSIVSGFAAVSAAYAETAGVPSAGVWLYGTCSYVGTVNPTQLKQQ